MPNNLPKAREIFLHAVGKLPPEQWEAYIAEMCGADADLAQLVRDLLQVHREAGSFLDAPAPGLDATLSQLPLERLGTTIGPYKLLQQIGEGGMGVVFMAEQTEPVERRVALKIIKPGMDSRQVVARFEAERQALAMMDHPNIAKVFEAGTTDSGRPYFVMELVKGIPITRYCDEHRLTPRERLDLFISVCHAVQHAHQKGIIHRDLKPSNVMVAQHDARPVVKVIDFGIAKATGAKLTDATLFTEFGQVVGTLEFMSPEQAGLNQLDIDTRSDIYSLGVLLYELLTGTTPLERKRVQEGVLFELLRLVREEEPPKPSARLSSTDGLPAIAANRGVEPVKLNRQVRGELDWIVMKALEKDRNRRYESASGFAADVQRYLADEPVLASPPSAIYRFRKFVSRNKGPVLAASVVFLSLLIGIVGTTWGMLRAETARQKAIVAEAKASDLAAKEERAKQQALAAAAAEKEAKQAAIAQAAETSAVLNFVQRRILAAARPAGQEGGLGSEVTLRQALRASLPFIGSSFKRQPRVEIRVRNTIGLSFQYLGDMKIAAMQFAAAHAISTRELGPDHAETLDVADNLANCYRFLGQFADALKLHQETLPLLKAKLGPDHVDTLGCMVNLASDYAQTGQTTESLELFEAALVVLKAKHPDHPFTLNCQNNLAVIYDTLGERNKALELREQTLKLAQAKRGTHHPETLSSMGNLAISYAAVGNYEKAIQLSKQTLAIQKERLGPDHPDTLYAMHNLASYFHDNGQHDEAIQLYQKALALSSEKNGRDHPDTLTGMHSLAVTYLEVGNYAEAVKLFKETWTHRKEKLGVDHPDTIDSLNGLAESYHGLGQTAQGFQAREEMLRLLKSKHGLEHADTLGCQVDLAIDYKDFGRPTEALELFESTLAVMRVEIPDHPFTLICMTNLVNSYAAAGRNAEALKLTEEVLPLIQRRHGLDHPQAVGALNRLAWMLANCPDQQLRNSSRAVKLAQKTVQLAPQEAGCWNTLGAAQYRAGKWQAAVASLEKSIELGAEGDGFDWFFLAMAHWQLFDETEARTMFDKAVQWMEQENIADEELRRLHIEAADLLGVQDEPKPVKSPASKSSGD